MIKKTVNYLIGDSNLLVVLDLASFVLPSGFHVYFLIECVKKGENNIL